MNEFEQRLVAARGRLNAWVAFLADVAAIVGPVLAPAPSVYIAFRHMTLVLLWDPWAAVVIGLGIELLGFAVVSTGVEFWQSGEDKGRLWLVVLAGVFYLALVTTVNVVLDPEGGAARVAKGLLSLLPLVGSITLGVRAQHMGQVASQKAEKMRQAEWRREVNQQKREMAHELEMKRLEVGGPSTTLRAGVGKVSERSEYYGKWQRWPDVPSEIQKKVLNMSGSEVQKVFGVSEKTAYNWKRYVRRDYGDEGV